MADIQIPRSSYTSFDLDKISDEDLNKVQQDLWDTRDRIQEILNKIREAIDAKIDEELDRLDQALRKDE